AGQDRQAGAQPLAEPDPLPVGVLDDRLQGLQGAEGAHDSNGATHRAAEHHPAAHDHHPVHDNQEVSAPGRRPEPGAATGASPESGAGEGAAADAGPGAGRSESGAGAGTTPEIVEAIARLDAITRRLRTECPWDREQDERSIVPHTVEQAYELADAAHRRDDAKLLDELGDVLFQVHFLALLLEERGTGDLEQVADRCAEKL